MCRELTSVALFMATAFALIPHVASQQTRESAAKNMRQLLPAEVDPTYKQTAPYAQRLVEDELAAHPSVLLIGLHITPPNQSTNVIVASNFGRIGKLADKDDLRVIRTGVSNFDVEPSGNTFEAEIPIHERSGQIVGAVSIVFNFKHGDDEAGFTREARKIAREIDARTTSLNKLFGPAD